MEAAVATEPRPNDAAYYLDNAVRLPIYAAHGGKDEALPISATRAFVERLKRHGASSNITWREYPQAGHGNYNALPEVFDWMARL